MISRKTSIEIPCDFYNTYEEKKFSNMLIKLYRANDDQNKIDAKL